MGIKDINMPDYGDAVRLKTGGKDENGIGKEGGEGDDADGVDGPELPVFWACGITTQQGLISAGSKVKFAITHAPGHMLLLDLLNNELGLLE